MIGASIHEILEQNSSQFANSSGEIQFDGLQTLTIDTMVVMAQKDVYLRAVTVAGFEVEYLAARVTVHCTTSETLDVQSVTPIINAYGRGSSVQTIDLSSLNSQIVPTDPKCPVSGWSLSSIKEQDSSIFANSQSEISFDPITLIL